ncbi:MAG: META domain-containing protein [Bryobacter sp.]|jgi:heat shock protein HslJ|nr:META domain-containing protein [Bryobacter sp. CoA8 C33]
MLESGSLNSKDCSSEPVASPLSGHRNLSRGAFLEFDPAAQRVSGNLGCNQFSGRYQASGNSLTFSEIVSTMMACTGVRQLLERQTQEALAKTRSFRLENGALILLDETGAPAANLTRP